MRDKVRIKKTLEYGWCVIWPEFGFSSKHVDPKPSFAACIDAVSHHKIVDTHNGAQVSSDSYIQRDARVGTAYHRRLDIC